MDTVEWTLWHPGPGDWRHRHWAWACAGQRGGTLLVTIAPDLLPAVRYEDNDEDSRVCGVLTRSPMSYPLYGSRAELESGDTISGGSFCAGAGRAPRYMPEQ